MVLIAESGSTKTQWVFFDEQGQNWFTSVGLNPHYLDSSEICEIVRPIFKANIHKEVKHIYFYGAGVTDDEKKKTIQDGILRAFGYDISITPNSDIVAAAVSLWGDRQGLTGILGTGSNSCFWNGQTVSFQIPPLGFWLGDEGSGGCLGKSLVLCFLHDQLPQDLRHKFIQEYGELNRLDVLNKVFKEGRPNAYFGGFATFCNRNIENEFIADLVKNNFRQFFKLYISRYEPQHRNTLGIVGSMAHFFEKQVRDVAKEFGIIELKVLQKPIDGLVTFHQEYLSLRHG
ncbi:MAG: N-acetylglucosamine kinase [Leadbetterella sp.]